MSARDHKNPERSPKAAADRGPKSTVKVSRRSTRLSGATERTLTLPAIDQDRLTIILLSIIVVLGALNFMLRFPELGAVIASYNQF